MANGLAELNDELGLGTGPRVPATLGGGRLRQQELTGLAGLNQSLEGPELTDEQLAAQAVGQQSLGPPLPIPERARLRFRSDTFDELQTAFAKRFPEGEIFEVPNTELTLFRRDAKEPFGVFDPQSGGGDLPADIAEFFAEKGPAMATEIATALATRGRSLLSRVGKTAVGAAAGEAGRQAAQSALGTQTESTGEILGRIATEGAASFVGGTLGEAGGVVWRSLRGNGLRQTLKDLNPQDALAQLMVSDRGPLGGTSRAGVEAEEAAARLRERGFDVPDPVLFEVTDNPIAKGLGRQALSIQRGPMQELIERQARRAGAAESLSTRQQRAKAVSEITKPLDQIEKGVSEFAINLMRNPKRLTSELVVKETDKFVRNWWDTSANAVDELYSAARAVQEPRFDLSEAQEIAREIQRGIQAAGRPEVRPTGLIDEAGQEVLQTERRNVQVSEIDSQVASQVEKLLAIDPNLPRLPGTDSAVEVLRALRRNLADLSLLDPRSGRAFVSDAPRLKAAIDKALKSPTNANPEFMTLWRKADQSAAKRFRTRELLVLGQLASSTQNGLRAIPENAEKFAKQFILPGSRDNLIALAQAGGKKSIEPFQDLFLRSLAQDPLQVTKTLNGFDQGTLRILLTREEESALRGAAKQLDLIDSSGIRKALKEQTQTSGFVSDLVFDQKSSRAITDLMTFVQQSGGIESPVGNSVRAAINGEIFARARTLVDTRQVLDKDKLSAVLLDLDRKGALGLLTPAEQSAWKDFNRMAQIQTKVADFATGLMTAEVVSDARALLFPFNPETFVRQGLSASQTLLENHIVGRMMTQEAGRKFLTAGGEKINPKWFRLFGAALGTAFNSDQFSVLGGSEDGEQTPAE